MKPQRGGEVVSEPLLEAKGLIKSFGRVHALRGADFTVYTGEVVALIGDNGAGKSTLVKMLSACIRRTRARSASRAARSTIPTPEAARELGIETVYQDLALAPDLESAANLFLGREVMRGGLLGRLGLLDKSGDAQRTASGVRRARRRRAGRPPRPSRSSPAASARASRSPAP